MNRFKRKLQVELRPEEKYPYKLINEITIRGTGITGYGEVITKYLHLKDNGDLTIMVNYAWDGATGAIDTVGILLASLVHDAFYQLMRLGLVLQCHRKKADQLLVDIAIANGMTVVRSLYVYLAVRLIGWKFTQPCIKHLKQ